MVDDTLALPLADHPLRAALSNEVHARPHEMLSGRWAVSHLAVLSGETSAAEELALVADLAARFGADAPPAGAVYHSAAMNGVRLRWERHTEFSTWTFLRPLEEGAPASFETPALAAVPRDWLARLPGALLVAMHVVIDDVEIGPEDASVRLGGGRVVGSRVGGGGGAVYTDFLTRPDGFGRAVIGAQRLTPGQTGRTLQRMLEIETYRMMALLAFPPARETGPRLSVIESGVAAVTAELAAADGEADGARDRALLERLTALSAENERLLAGLNYRLSASRAYHAIVQRAVEDMREERFEGTQTVAEFLARRLMPAMRTCEHVGNRMETLSKRLTRASDLLRTRVDIALGENNRDLLRSMNRRAELQLRLQETVEGLSVVAISYYLLGLLGYAAKGLKEVGVLPVKPEVAVLAGLPLVVALVFVGVRRLRRAVNTGGGH